MKIFRTLGLRSAALALAIACAPLAAEAQQPDKRTADYVWSPENRKQLQALGLNMDRTVLDRKPCQGKYVLQPVSVGIAEPLEFPSSAAHPTRGAWTVRFRFERCGESTVYNAMFRAREKGAPALFRLHPGTSRVPLALLRQVDPQIEKVARARNGANPDCKSVVVTDASVTAEPRTLKAGDETIEGVWEEQWSVRTCSGPFSVDFCFVPDRQGGAVWTQSKCDPAQIARARASSAGK